MSKDDELRHPAFFDIVSRIIFKDLVVSVPWKAAEEKYTRNQLYSFPIR